MHSSAAGPLLWLWGLLGLALLTLIVVVIIWLIRHMLAGSRRQPDRAEEDLRRRYAAGEIDQEEYQRRLGGLRDR